MDPILGQIMLWSGIRIPSNWVECNGQLLNLQQNAALYSLLGTTYGGDGRTNFAVPDLRGRVPVGVGQGPGLTNRALGQQVGSEAVAITQNNLPAHTHPSTITATNNTVNIKGSVPMPPIATNDSTFTPTKTPSANTCLGISPSDPASGTDYNIYAQIPSGGKPNINLANNNITLDGNFSISGSFLGTVGPNAQGTQALNVMQPSIALKYIIAVLGIYPNFD